MASENQANQPSKQQLPPFASWPTIKILSPPKGRFSPKTDEWCLTYCSQSVTGRFHGKEPTCRSVCIRKVFPHEVRNIIAFKTHSSIGPDGKATYPLPAEGQPANVPRWLGGKPPTDNGAHDDDEEEISSYTPQHQPIADPVKHWDEGWYFWTSSSRYAIHEKLDSMRWDLARQQTMHKQMEGRQELWQEYQEHLKNGDKSADVNKWWGPIIPPRPIPEFRSQSLLVPLPLDSPPFWDRMNKLFDPTRKALNIFMESVKSGEQRELAERVWDKAWTPEPFQLANKAFGMWYDMLKDWDSPDSDKKST
ncbi:hypothetical protein H0H93_006785 [Arthromyces matolae]|nr:hypothetical protein H0H93_006785 [Arthromyces matolae]